MAGGSVIKEQEHGLDFPRSRAWRRTRQVSLLLMVVLLFGMFTGLPARAAPSGSDSLAEGLASYRAGDRDRALALLLDFVQMQPEAPQVSEASLVLARIYHERRQPEEVLRYIAKIPKAQRGTESRLLEGMAEIRIGQVERGIALLRPLDESQLAFPDRRARLAGMADGYSYLGRWLEALFFIDRSLALAGTRDEKVKLQQQARELIVNQLSDGQLAEAAFMFRGSPVGQQAGLEQAQRYFRAGRNDRALSRLEKVLQDPTDFPERMQAVQLRERLAGTLVPNRSIGVILPLSGRYAGFGKLVKRGMELAAEEQRVGQLAVQLIFKDSAGDPEQSAKAVSELANVAQVMGIIGPLTGTAAGTAAERAELEQVPLLTLSQRKGLPEKGAEVFRSSLTHEQQARSLVRYAMEERNLSTFGILAPDNRLGQEMANAFAREVETRGGRIAARQDYPERATDFRRQIKLLKGEDPDAPDLEPDDHESGVAEPPLPFEALFIPDYAQRIGLIAPQLPFYGIRDLQLLGINGWNSPDLLRRGGNFVEGAVFVDGFFRYSGYPFVKEFVNRSFERYGEEPTILEAQGFDAAGIMLSLAGRADVRTRDELRRALARLQNYPGVTGATSFDERGDAQKVLFLLQVKNGNIVQIN
jgi:branched-chain amino acid transport system substrate-binding protein